MLDTITCYDLLSSLAITEMVSQPTIRGLGTHQVPWDVVSPLSLDS